MFPPGLSAIFLCKLHQVTPAYDGALDGLEEAKQSMLAEFSRRKLLTT